MLKSLGYSLIALEQTSKSIPVQDFQFPEKSALILGNEGLGCPLEILEMMDIYLEIP